jgi:hypothetical protein
MDGGPIRHLLPLACGWLLRILSQYKHLGVWRRAFGGAPVEGKGVNLHTGRPHGLLPLRPWPAGASSTPKCRCWSTLLLPAHALTVVCCTSLVHGRCCRPTSSRK